MAKFITYPENKSHVVKAPEISVLVPVMNEAGNIRPLIDEICDTFNGRQFEIIYIDDGSTDDTELELENSLNEVKELRVLKHTKRSGQSVAIRTGLLASRAPLIAVLDGDGQNIPQDLLALEAALMSVRPKIGMAGGVRQGRKDSAMKKFASRTAKNLRGWFLNDSHPDSGCGIKIIDRDIFLRLPFFNHMHRFMSVLVRREGGVVLEVPVGHRARDKGISKYGILDRLLEGISDILGVLWLLKRTNHPEEIKEKIHNNSKNNSTYG